MKSTGSTVRMKILVAVSLLGPAAGGGRAQTAPEAAPSVQEQFIGVFELTHFRGHGDDPTGRISYDRAGRMWAMLLPPGRPAVDRSSKDEDYRAAMRGLIAYYGTYDVDEENGTVTHHIEAASNPSWVGDDFVRWYRFEDGDLVISLSAEFENVLQWERLPVD